MPLMNVFLSAGRLREFLFAVHAVAAGGAIFSPAVSRRLLQAGLATGLVEQQDAKALFARLTPREQEVLRLVGDGLSNAEIAERLFLAEGTVKVHATSILRTTGACYRVEAALIAAHTPRP